MEPHIGPIATPKHQASSIYPKVVFKSFTWHKDAADEYTKISKYYLLPRVVENDAPIPWANLVMIDTNIKNEELSILSKNP